MTTEYFGYAGTILRVNLSTREVTRQPFPREWMRMYLGGEGVAARMLYDEVPPEVTALSPQSKVVLSAGPLVGTLAPSCGRITLTAKSPITEIYSDSNAGGHLGPEMKYAGYDHIVVEGSSDEPVYLWVDDDNVEVRDARHLWGKTTWETDDILKAETGDASIQTASIGPAGENLSLAACVIVNRARAFGRTGLGAVVGSKKLKAIAIRGSKGISIARPSAFLKECRRLLDKIRGDELYAELAKGSMMIPDLGWDGSRSRPLASMRYGHTGKSVCENYAEISCRNVNEKVFDRGMACFGCPIHCAHWSSIKEGPWRGEHGEGFELNIQEDCTSMDTCSDVWFLPKFNFLCNQLGLGVDEVAQPIAYSMWLFEKGILTAADTGGIDIRWGDNDTVLKLTRMAAYQEGFGAVLAEGTRKMGRRFGRGAEYWARNIKGSEVIADTRLTYEVALGEGVSPRGACHLKGLPRYLTKGPPTPEFLAEIGRVYGSPHAIIANDARWVPYGTRYMIRLMSTLDNLGLCVFASHRILGHALRLEDLAPIVQAATGIPFTHSDLVDAADRARIVQRAFNHRLGLGRNDDFPPSHTFEHPLKLARGDGSVRDRALDRSQYDAALTEFYCISGYDERTGVPTRATMSRLGLGDIADDLDLRGILSG